MLPRGEMGYSFMSKGTEITGVRWLLLTWPNAGKNLLGWLFIGSGALLAICLAAGPMITATRELGFTGPVAAFPALLLVLAGAWLGAGAYSLFFCRGGTRSVIPCPRCTQKLRLPGNKGTARITCPSCRNSFEKHIS